MAAAAHSNISDSQAQSADVSCRYSMDQNNVEKPVILLHPH